MNAFPPSAAAAVRTRLLAVAVVVLMVILLRMTRTVTMPVVAGLLVAALVWPLLLWLERFLPRALALLGTVLVVVLVIVGLFATLAWGGASVGERMMERGARLEELRRQVEQTAGIALPGGATGGASGGASGAEPTGGSGSGGMGLAQRAGSMAFSTFAGLALMVGFMALALAEARDTRERVRHRFHDQLGDRIVEIAGEVASAMQRYFLVKSLTSFIAGVSTLLITLLFGLDFWYLWGLLAFLLEYVPTIGSILAVIPPALWAAIQFDGYARPLAVTGALTVMQLLLGNYVDPKIEGRFLALSPFVVLLSIVFWAWLWGAPGSLLGVPLTLAITTTAKHFQGTRWIWAILTERNGQEKAGNG